MTSALFSKMVKIVTSRSQTETFSLCCEEPSETTMVHFPVRDMCDTSAQLVALHSLL
jgi:hypothetical protein